MYSVRNTGIGATKLWTGKHTKFLDMENTQSVQTLWDPREIPLARGESPKQGDIIRYNNRDGTSTICRVKKGI